MQKYILYFGEDPDLKGIYDLVVKAIQIPTDQLEFYRDDLQEKGFEIFMIAHNSIEAKFSGDYLMVADMIRQLDQEGWTGKLP
jgi:hypothetical protein